MKTVFKKVITGVVTTAMVAGLLVGVNVTKTEVKAADEVTLTPWSFYEGAASFRNEEDPWAARFYNSVSTTAGETLTGWGSSEAATEEMTQSTTKPADGFTADIATTGWDGDYTVKPAGNNPYMLRAMLTNLPAKMNHDYTISFTAEWTNTKNAPEKNVMIGVSNAYGESVFANVAGAVTQIKIPSGGSVEYSQDFTLWAGETLAVDISFGAFLKDYNDGKTTEQTDASGVLKITNFKIVDNGENPNAPDVPDKPTVKPTTPNQTNPGVNNPTTKAPTQNVNTTTKKPTVAKKKLAKVKKLKVKNTKKRTIKITWKKVAKAKSYQVKVGKKTYTTKKVKLTVKKLKKGRRYTVKVRAKAAGYKTGAWATKKIKIKK